MRIFALALLTLLVPDLAFAHAFGAQFTLPLPVHYYIYGGLGAFIASCLILLFFSKPLSHDVTYGKTFSLPILPTLGNIVPALSSLFLVFFIVLGFFGPESFEQNPLPNFFWIIVLLLFGYTTALIGGLWRYADPFRTIVSLCAPVSSGRNTPEWFQYFPSTLLFALLWLELFSHGSGASPSILASALLGYTLLSIAMSWLYGSNAWFSTGDLFSNIFSVFSRAAPVQIGERDIDLVAPGERATHESAPDASALLFICILLGATVLDGLRETMIWWQIGYAINPDPRTVGQMSLIALFLLPYILLLLYFSAIRGMKLLTKSELTVDALALRFAYSLAPIAVAYHFAHYFSLILSQGQIFVAQISDPFGMGWNIFGTAGYVMNPALIGADMVWYLQLSVIVGGHILAAVIAHRISRRVFHSTFHVVVSQLPMLILMVLFTTFGLWTLAQPFLI